MAIQTDAAYQNAMKNNDKKTARIEHDAALQRVMIDLLSDHTELFKQFSDNPQLVMKLKLICHVNVIGFGVLIKIPLHRFI
jgi:hypothetical protein